MLQHINLYYQQDNNEHMPTNIEREIQQLINDLEQLKIEFNNKSDRITKKLTKLSEKVNRDTQQIQSTDIEVGHIVQITNNYKGTKGITGTVERVTDKQVTLREYHTDKTFTRSKNNVKRL